MKKNEQKNNMQYKDFLKNKEILFNSTGFVLPKQKLNPNLYPFQKEIILWALKKGKAALFEDCGLGKTIQQLEWANQINLKEKYPILILAPLAVSQQTKQEGLKFGIEVNICNSQNDIKKGINITNYEKLHKFNVSEFCGVVLDESSILKSINGAVKTQIIESFNKTPYKLACSATPSPNDYIELGNHSEFLGIMKYSEMLSMFFVNDSGDTGTWRLKKHAKEDKFWQWVCSWAIMISKPSDIGFEQKGYDLPKLNYHEHKIISKKTNIEFFEKEAQTLDERREIRKQTIEERCKKTAEIVNNNNDQWIIWCDLNTESSVLTKLIKNAHEISGATPIELREQLMLDFAAGKIQRLITKPSIAGFGMNWQNCHNIAFTGLSDSWEKFYQAIRRSYRFGQKNNVNVHIIIADKEGSVLDNIYRKDKQAKHMLKNIIKYTKNSLEENLYNNIYIEKIKLILPRWITKQ